MKGAEELNAKGKELDEWKFTAIDIAAPSFMHDFIYQSLKNDMENGKGLFANITDISREDEADDDFFIIEAYGLKCSLEPFYRDLQQYGILDSLLSEPIFRKGLLSTLKETILFIKDNTTTPNKVRNYIADTISCFDKMPGWGLLFQTLLLQGQCKWFEDININEGDNGFDEAQNMYNWICERLFEKEICFCSFFWGDGDKERLKPLCNYLNSTTMGQMVQKALFEDDSESDAEYSNEENINGRYYIQDSIIQKVYEKCNGVQWENILIDNFIDLLNSNGENQSLIIRNKEINRTKVVFKMIAKNIDKAMLKEWIEGIEKNVFGGVEFMKSTLRTDKLSSGYSDKDVKFKPFIDSL